MSAHTPGPWVATDQGDVVMDADLGCIIAWCGDADDNPDMGEVTMLANARFIAAAPDGFEAAGLAYLALLRTPLASVERMRIEPVLCALRDYLAKATGATGERIQTEFEARAAEPPQ